MFETTIGPVKDAGSTVYLRPETAQGIFLAFKTTLQYARRKPPFGIAQIGKSFRNEITPGNFIFRTLEFEQMEMEFFVPPAEAESWHEHWMQERMRLVRGARPLPRAAAPARARRRGAVALLVRHQRHRVPLSDRLVRARGHRQPRRLRPDPARGVLRREARVRRHRNRGALRPARDRAGRRRGRTILALLCDAYDEEEVEGSERAPCCGCTRIMAPVKVAVLPLRQPRRPCPSRRASSTRTCARGFRPSTTPAARSASATAARTRSARPGAMTVDHQTMEDDTVTLRDRDSLEQVATVHGRRGR